MKILLIKAGGVIAPYIIESYHKAFQQLGHEIIVADFRNGNIKYEEQKSLVFANPDLVIGYGKQPMIYSSFCQNVGVKLNIPLAYLYYDNPFFGFSENILPAFSAQNDIAHHFVWDSYFKDLMLSSGFKNVHNIMLATDPDYFYPQNIYPQNTLCFVGSFDKNEALKISSKNTEINIFVDTVIDLKLKNIDVPVMEIMAYLFKTNKFKNIKEIMDFNPFTFWQGIYAQIHSKGSLLVRDYFLRCIDGIDIHIYGNTKLDKNNVTIHAPVQYDTELRSVYEGHKVILNISSLQLETSVNNRVFDVFAAGGYVLSDYKKDMEILFPNHYREITFRNLNELGVIADYYLTHEKERTELIKELRNYILEKHTYKNRAETIIRTIFN